MLDATRSDQVAFGRLTIDRTKFLRVTTVATVSMVLLYASVPAMAPAILIGSCLTAITWTLADKLPLRRPWQSAMAGCLLAFILWMFVTLLWTPNVRAGFPAALNALLFAAAVITAGVLAPYVAADARRRVAIAFTLAAALATVLLFFEAFTGMALRRSVMSLVPPLRSTTPGTLVEHGWVTVLPTYLIKKNVAAVMLMAWPALLIARTLITTRATLATTAAFGLVFIVTINFAGHNSSKVALLASSGVFLLATFSRALAHRAAILVWAALSLAVVPLMLAAYHGELYRMPQIQYSGQHRIVIWGHTSHLVLAKPILGAGLAATRYLDETSRDHRPLVAGTKIESGTNIHSHNIFLQTWHELGGVGAVLLFGLGLAVLSWIGRANTLAAPYLYATFAAVVTIASLSWSLIAIWFMASLCFVAVIGQMAAAFADDEGDPPPISQL